jgi:DNA-binding LacI/PurR family transcriptional regulator
MAVTLRDVAARAGVSPSAVSRVFTPGASVSAATRAKVEAAAAALNYRPSILASALSTRRTKLIGLVSTNFQNPVFLEIFDRFTRGLQARALRPLLVNLSDEMTLEAAVQMLRQYSVDGVILASSTLPPDFPLAFAAAGLPVVHAFGRAAGRPGVHLVGIDNRRAGQMAAQTLLARGYRRLGFLGGPRAATSTEDRLAGFLDGAAACPGATVETGFATAYAFDAGRAAMQARLPSRVEAWFCGDDVLSMGAIGALAAAGLRVPQDVGILGLNDMEMTGWPTVNLTTIRQPIPQIIEAAIARMAACLDGGDAPPVAQVFDCTIVERGTLRPLQP